MKNNRLPVILLTAAMVMCTAGCGNKDAAPETPVPEEPSVESQTVEVSDISEIPANTEYLDYTPGTYYQESTEEIDGKPVEVTYAIELFEDQTGIMHIQDDIEINWDETRLYTTNSPDENTAYWYTIEGDSLYVEFEEDGDWVCFERGDDYTSIEDAEFGEYAGTYSSQKGHTLVIDEKGNVKISLIHITELEGKASSVENGIMPIEVTDESGNPMQLEFNVDTKDLTVTDSTWPGLLNGDHVVLDK